MNVANLLFVRATARQRELAVRAALGSGRRRLIQLLLLESLILGVAGTAAGLVLAGWATDLFLASVTPAFELPLNLSYDFDWRVFVYAGAVATTTGLLVGVLPALRASRPKVTGVLHDGGYGSSTGGSRIRVRNLLVIAQVAGSLVLLVVAGLFIRSLQRSQFVDLAFEPRGAADGQAESEAGRIQHRTERPVLRRARRPPRAPARRRIRLDGDHVAARLRLRIHGRHA
jgi:hypothetical protein